MKTEEVEKLFHELKRSFEVGTINEEEFQAEVKELFFQDDEGNYWTIGAKTEKWYRYDDGDWVQESPPPTLESVRQEVRPPGMEQKASPSSGKWDYDNRVVVGLAGLLFLLCLVVVALASYQLGRLSVVTSPAEDTPTLEMTQVPAVESIPASEVSTATTSPVRTRGIATPLPTTTEEETSPTPSLAPTDTPTPGATSAPQPTATTIPTPQMKYSPPILVEPMDGAIFGPGYDAVLKWESVGRLAEDEYYDVQICWNNCNKRWGHYLQDTTWIFPSWFRGEAVDDKFYWSVTARALRGETPAGPMDPAISPQSETWVFMLSRD